MASLVKTRVLSNQRLGLTTYNNIEGFVCTDFIQLLRNLVTNTSYIIDGFRIYQDSGVTNDNPVATPIYVKLAGGMILHTDPTNTFSGFYVGADSLAAARIDLTDNATNFIEVEFSTETGSPDTEVFWDPSAGGGQGEEFTQIVDTVENLVVSVTVNTSSFSGVPKLRLAEIVMSGGVITSIEDKRDLFFSLRKANPYLPQSMYAWPSGTDEPNPDRKVDANAFTGADKGILDWKTWMDAVMTEIYRIKFGSTPAGGEYWFTPNETSLKELSQIEEAIMYSDGTFAWNLSAGRVIATDQITVLYPNSSAAVVNTIAASEWTSEPALTASGDLYYVDLQPETDGASLTLHKATVSTYTDADNRTIIAKRIGNNVYLNPLGAYPLELKDGESAPFRSELTDQILQFIGATSAADSTPPYTQFPSSYLAHQFTGSSSLTEAISANTGNINDIVTAIQKVYREPLHVVSGAPASDNEVSGPVVATTLLTIPLDSRDGDAEKDYLVGNGALLVFLNGVALELGVSWAEFGTSGQLSNQIQILEGLVVGDKIEFVILTPEVFGGTLGAQPFFRNEITGQTTSTIGTGAPYNLGTNKLCVWRNGLFETNSASVGSATTRYQELTDTSINLGSVASAPEVFTFVNHVDPGPSVVNITNVTGSILTVPTYVIGSKRLRIFRNGLFMTTNVSASAADRYTETSTTTVALATAAVLSDVFVIWIDGQAPTWREELTGFTGSVLTIPNAHSYTIGNKRLLVFRNGILLLNSISLASPVDRYQESSTTQVTLEVSATPSDFFTFLYVQV